MYTKTLNNISVKNVNLRPAVGQLDGADDRPVFNVGDPIDSRYSFISLVDNTSEGYTWNTTLKVEKPMTRGFGGSLAYSFTRAESLFDGRGFINATNWRNTFSLNGRNNPMLGRSNFDVGSRVTGVLSYRAEYAGFLATTVSLFYNGQSGEPYSYVYQGSDALLNDDDQGFERALVYVPASQDEIVFGQFDSEADELVVFSSEQQTTEWNALNTFIEGDEYLSTRRGQYAEQNQSRTPFASVFDLKVLQDFYITTGSGRRHTLQVSLDVFNLSNLLNNDWGRRYFVGSSDNRYITQLLQFEGFEEGTNRPVYSFNDPGDPWEVNQSPTAEGSRWAAQVGVRYSF